MAQLVHQGKAGKEAWLVTISGSGPGGLTVSGTLSNNDAAPVDTNVGALVAVATAVAPTYTEGNLVGLSTDLDGKLRIDNTVRGGAKGTTVAADVTSTSIDADHQALDVAIVAGGSSVVQGGAKGTTAQMTITGTSVDANHNALDVQVVNQPPTVSLESTVTWDSSTPLNTVALIDINGYSNIGVEYDRSAGTVTDGVIAFEVGMAGMTPIPLDMARTTGYIVENTRELSSVSTPIGWQSFAGGMAVFQVRLTTAIVGTATHNISIKASLAGSQTAVTVGGTVNAKTATATAANPTFGEGVVDGLSTDLLGRLRTIADKPVLGTALYLPISTVDASIVVPAGNYLMSSTVDVFFKDSAEPTLNQSKILYAKTYVGGKWAASTTVHFKTAAGTGVVYLWPLT
jgi:hypothetical protein